MSKFLSYEDRLIIAQRLQENASFGEIGKELDKDRTTIAKEVKITPTIRRTVVPDIHIIPVSSVFPVRQRKYAELAVLMNRHTNAASVQSVPYTAGILRKTSALSRVNHPTYVTDAESFQSVHC